MASIHSLSVPSARDAAPEGRLLQWAPALAQHHVRYTTSSLRDAQAHLKSLHDSLSLTVERPESFTGYREVTIPFGNLLLTMGCIDAACGYELAFRSGDEYLITIPLCGTGWVSTGELFAEYGENDIMIVAPSCDVVKHWEGRGQTLSLHIPAARFDRAMRELGIEALPIAPFLTVGHRRLRSFLRVVDLLCRDLNDGSSPFLNGRLAEQLEHMLLTLLLEQLAGQAAPALPAHPVSPAIPYYVRRAEEFIAANAHRDIGIEDIAAAASVSLRSIQYGFRRYRNNTPTAYLKQVRFARARALLLASGDRRPKIGDVAAEVGCANVSQFSRDYRAMFGESPSETLGAPRRLVA